MKLLKKLCISLASVAIVLGSYTEASAQGSTLTPYSKYGYGMLSDGATSTQRAMGGVGYAMKGGRQINVMNPASYAAIDSLTFLWDIGVSMDNYWGSDDGNSAKKTGGGLDYITMQFPLGKRLGMSVGVIPFSTVGYSYGNDITDGSAAYYGAGGLSQAYAGLSARLFKGFSVGANVGYLWGDITNDNYAYASTGGIALFERQMNISDYTLNFGAQYSFNIGRKNNFTLGVTYAPEKDLHGKESGIYYDANSDTSVDTAEVNSLKGNYSMPYGLGAGIAYTYNNQLTVEFDYTYQPWSKAKFNSVKIFEQTTLDDRWKIAGGVQYVNAHRGSYLRRVAYRMGAFYNHDYMTINSNSVREYGITAGFGLPTPGLSKTQVNIGFEYKHRSTSPVKYVTEDYFTITLGVNFNETWFWKRKFE